MILLYVKATGRSGDFALILFQYDPTTMEEVIMMAFANHVTAKSIVSAVPTVSHTDLRSASLKPGICSWSNRYFGLQETKT